MAVLLETSLGDIVVDVYTEERPRCSLNFLKLCKIKFYNYSLFHTVQRNFLAQTGDPSGKGEGGESVWGVIKGEDYRYFSTETTPRIKHTRAGLVSMANNGHDCHGSQFFFTLGPEVGYLDGQHTVFGEVAEGMDVLTKINEMYCDKEGRPFQDIRIYHTVVLEDPFDDPPGLTVPERSPSPPKVVTDSNRIGAEEDIDDFKGMTEEEVREIMGHRESKANAQLLEMIGDIPDADAKPPENVLFVCKLNPVTTDEDLEIIFSRFGPIQSCEVIKDQKTGESLQYAFIEFEKEEDCVNAFFKMDNVLIDDRRIHVDFSQSLAKVKGLRRRTMSEKQSEKSGDDGLVATKAAKNDGYDMVFDDDEPGPSEKKRKKKNRWDNEGGSDQADDGKRGRGRDFEKKEERKKREQGRHRDDSGDESYRTGRSHREKDERRYRDRDRDRGDHRHRDRDRDHHRYRDSDRDRERRRRDDDGERREHKRRRSRSRSLERHHKASRHRSRS